MKDTTPEASRVQLDAYRRMTGGQRLETAMRMSRLARALAMARLRHAHPHWSDRELRQELARIALFPQSLPPAAP